MKFKLNSPHSRDINSFLHPMTNPSHHEKTGPMILDEGKGIFVKDLEGNEYIEGMAGLWCTSLGFSNERLVTAATAQLRKLPTYHTFFHRSNIPVIELAEKLLSIAPVPMSKVWFANSGSEANDHMVKFVWYYNNAKDRPKKKKIIARYDGYHGITISSGSLTGLPLMHKGFDLPIKNFLHTGSHNYYSHAKPGETEEEFASRRAQELETLILLENPDTIAAFVAEPVLGAGGAIVPPKTYFSKIQKILKKYDVLMVADEVITGFWRTGNCFGSQTYDIKPDILINAKQLSSAYLPISSVMINDEIFDYIKDFANSESIFATGFTYSGHPVSAAVALETLKIYDEMNIKTHIRQVSKVAQDRLSQLADHPLVGDVSGVGLIGSVELVKNKKTKENFQPEIAAWCAEACIRRGVMLRPNMGKRIAFCPPLIIKEEEVHMLFDRWLLGLNDTLQHVKKEGLF